MNKKHRDEQDALVFKWFLVLGKYAQRGQQCGKICSSFWIWDRHPYFRHPLANIWVPFFVKSFRLKIFIFPTK